LGAGWQRTDGAGDHRIDGDRPPGLQFIAGCQRRQGWLPPPRKQASQNTHVPAIACGTVCAWPARTKTMKALDTSYGAS